MAEMTTAHEDIPPAASRPAPIDAPSPPPTHWLGLVVAEVGRRELEWVASTGYTRWRELPTELVSTAKRNLAVVSWRWDVAPLFAWEPRPAFSRNLLSALRYARRAGITHLLVDVVSIDQTLAGPALVRQVVAFTALYRSVLVIAAYDTLGENVATATMRRPWVSYEIQAYRHNPGPIFYTSWRQHGNGATSFAPPRKSPPDGKKGGEEEEEEEGDDDDDDDDELDDGWNHQRMQSAEASVLWLSRALRDIWRSSYTLTISMLLYNSAQMTCIWDLKYILAEYAPLLALAEARRMSRPDFTLLAAILIQADLDLQPAYNVVTDESVRLGSLRTVLPGLSFFSARATPGDSRTVEISLPGGVVARWTNISTSRLVETYALRSAGGAERLLCDTLGVTGSEYDAYKRSKDDMRKRYALDQRQMPKVCPSVKVVNISFSSEVD